MLENMFNPEPICPHCGESETDAWEINFGGIEGEVEHDCGSCGESYLVSREVSITYSTKQKGQP